MDGAGELHVNCGLTETYNKIGTFSTEASINTLLDMLYAMVFARNYRRNLEFKLSSSRAVEVNRRVD